MKRVFNLLVVDESGSMSIIRRQALVGINETLATIQKKAEGACRLRAACHPDHLRQHAYQCVL